jgi:hypothetical protein
MQRRGHRLLSALCITNSQSVVLARMADTVWSHMVGTPLAYVGPFQLMKDLGEQV